jgi:hypothetical protein
MIPEEQVLKRPKEGKSLRKEFRPMVGFDWEKPHALALQFQSLLGEA